MNAKPGESVVDLSHPLGPDTPFFPGQPSVEIAILDSADQAMDAETRHLNCSRLTAHLHCGTHMDAPFHFFGSKSTIDQVPLDACIGPAVLVRLGQLQPDAIIERAALEDWADQLVETRRLVLDTGWYRHWGSPGYFTDHPVITGDAAHFLVVLGVVLLGVDIPSLDHFPFPAHEALLDNDVLILENLTNLHALSGPLFQLVAIPLGIAGREASPVRAIAIGEPDLSPEGSS